MPSAAFNRPDASDWPMFTSVETVRTQFAKGTAIMVAIGGWGDTAGFSEAAATQAGRERFAKNVKAMIARTGADGTVTVSVSGFHY